MSKFFIMAGLILLLLTMALNAQNVTPRQYFFTVKKIFPHVKYIDVILEQSQVEKYQKNIAKAAAQTQIKAKIYPVYDFKSIGKSIKKIEKSSILIVIPSAVLNKKSSKLFILSRCKEKDIMVVTESKDYSDSGALLGIFTRAGAKTKIVLNLKHNQELLAKFTPEYAKQTGISEVIQ